MHCFGKMNLYDRICELCLITNADEAEQCLKITTFKNELNTLIIRCPYRAYIESRHNDDYALCNKTNDHCYCFTIDR